MTDPTQRLSEPAGLLIDRRQTVSFSFEGRSYRGLHGDSLASALFANGEKTLSRSFKYHRRRGVLSMAGQDANTLVTAGGEPNVLADRVQVSEGLQAVAQNTFGNLRRDALAIMNYLGHFLPAGFYYRAFFRPRGVWRFWEPVIRRMAGLGVLPTVDPESVVHSKSHTRAHRYLHCDIAVVGAGPAGISAALAAAEAGASVVLIEENSRIGGSLTYANSHLPDPQQTLAELETRLEQQTTITVLSDATCTGWFHDHLLSVIAGDELLKIRAGQCILATGCFEQHLVFRNNDLPGVMLASAAQRLMAHYGIAPGRRAVVATVNDDGLQCALDLSRAGVEVATVVDLRAAGEADIELLHQLTAANIPYAVECAIAQARSGISPGATCGELVGVEVRHIVAPGELAAAGDNIECDLLCMAGGTMPAYQLACQGGARLGYHDDSAEFFIENLPPGMHLAGSVRGVRGSRVAGVWSATALELDGVSAAQQALSAMGFQEATVEQGGNPVEIVSRVNHSWPIFAGGGKDFVDLDEDLQVGDICGSVQMGYRDVQLVKRFSTVGMGPSQGRHASLPTALLVARETNRRVNETGVTTARPPFSAEKLSVLAGPSWEPVRRTSMHHRHEQMGAVMMPAGAWQRPAFYGSPDKRDECIQREVAQVRQAVGAIDISTLGGLEIRGSDSCELLARIYANPLKSLAAGKARYVVALNEMGFVIDDGVAVCTAENNYYVTATTTGVDRLYREITRWNAQWRLDVDVVNVSSAFSAVNVAGPLSREVMTALCPGQALDGENFPFMAARNMEVAGIAARVVRVGFVGELGFEIHVPSSRGLELWDRLFEAGAGAGILPFGVEAQRLLRLEKGHVIVGQDTDGATHPDEVGLTWAAKPERGFFIGGRSVAIHRAKGIRRKLVGFRLKQGAGHVMEGDLVMKDGNIAGNVTSCGASVCAGAIIGLAYTEDIDAVPGDKLRIRALDGTLLTATVAGHAFYDPDNKRQAL